MPYCQECGKKVAANAKFCRNCGASQLEESETVAPVVSPPVPAPKKPKAEAKPRPKAKPRPEPKIQPDPIPVPGPEPARTCSSCGKPVGPGEEKCPLCACAETISRRQPSQEPVPEPFPEPATPGTSPPAVCTGCGSPLGVGEKTCGVCGAVVPAEPAAVPALSTPSAAPPVCGPAPVLDESPGGRKCRVCGNVIKTGDRFCGRCCAKVVDDLPVEAERAAVPKPSSPSLAATSPEPVVSLAGKLGYRMCRSCGNEIKPGDKFCGKCCAIVIDVQPLTAVPGISPESAGSLRSPVTPSYVCASCGSPINSPDEFCGICGSDLPAIPASSPEPVQPAGNVCESCGSPINDVIKFCGSCGSAVNAGIAPSLSTLTPSPITPAASSASGEKVMGVIGNAKKMKMLGASWDTYTIVITDQRMILAQMSQEMINTAIREAQAAAKAEGKGFVSQMKHQMSAMFRYSQRYLTLSPDQALAENKKNRGIGNRSISSIKMKLREAGSDAGYREFRILIEAHEGKFEFTIAEDERFIDLFRQVYGDKVHLPPGYLSAAGVRIKLF